MLRFASFSNIFLEFRLLFSYSSKFYLFIVCFIRNIMSATSSNFKSTQKIPQEALQLNKLTKVSSGYLEISAFKNSDTHRGYFCYNCIYFMKPNHCAIVTDEGQDVDGNVSNVIAPYGICSLWTPNEKEIK
jgi:hypothetical protein